ncbi:MAG: endo-1,4-beta-xylanase, partial [Rhabdaerophilum sp.]
ATSARHIDISEFAAALQRECSILVGENDFKWRNTQPQPDRKTWGHAEAVANFAQRHKMQLRGHTMIWHEAMPPWALEGIKESRERATQILRDRVNSIGAQFRGRIATWDVVNEAIERRDGLRHGMRNSAFFSALGEGYLDLAFATAKEIDPAAHRAYNDFGMDHEVDWQRDRRRDVLTLLERLQARKVPIDTLGIQAHLRADLPFRENTFRTFLRRVADLGLRIEITEFDVNDRALPADTAIRDKAVADLTRRYLDVALDEPKVVSVLTWGISDRHSWLSDMPDRRRADGLRQRGLPFDEVFQRKPMWHAIAKAFDAAPAR